MPPFALRPPPELDAALLNGDRGTAWTNLGLWCPGDDYADAARALALRLGEAAGLGPGHRVLDVGVGHGEQLGLWIRRFGVRRVLGVDRSPEAVRRARARVARWDGEDPGVPAGRVRIQVADAARLRPEPAAFDRVVALDAAYHLSPRRDFFAAAHRALVPGGRLALTDLMVPGSLAPPSVRALAPLLGIPRENLLTPARYTERLQAAGFTEVTVEDLSGAVLGGFARWARGRGSGGSGRLRGGRLAVTLTGWLAGWAHRSGRVSYRLVTARKAAP